MERIEKSLPLAFRRAEPDTSVMPPANDERRYSDEEFAVILRTASEVPGGLIPALPPQPQDGLTLSQIQEIASEVGIDPGRVSRAAALLPSGDASALMSFLGGQPRHRLEATVPASVPTAALGRIVEVARNATGTQGEAREVLGGLEWKGSTATATFGASITPHEDHTTLHAWTDRTESMAGIYAGAGFGVLGVVALTMGKLVFGETDAGIVAALLSGIPPAFLFARTLWKRSTKKYKLRLIHLMDAMAKEAEGAVEGSGASGEGSSPSEETPA